MGDDAPAWEIDAPWPVSTRLNVGGGRSHALSNALARVRLTGDGGACLERLTGTIDDISQQISDAFSQHQRVDAAPAPWLDASVLSSRVRYPLRCARH
jgi:hypothetical protein